MEQFGKKDLLFARNSAGLSRSQAAPELGVSEGTLRNWEDTNEKTLPGPDDVWRMEKVYGVKGMWFKWCQSHYDSFRENFPEQAPDYNVAMALVNVRHQMADMLALQDRMERDSMDGHVDDQETKKRYCRELDELQAALTQARRMLE